MLMQRDYSGLVSRFGYALAHDREPTAALEADYLKAAASPLEGERQEKSSVRVKYFESNDTGLFAVVECVVPMADQGAVLLELIVTGKDEEKHITVEDVSGEVF